MSSGLSGKIVKVKSKPEQRILRKWTNEEAKEARNEEIGEKMKDLTNLDRFLVDGC